METTDGLENSVVFHVVKEIIGFILYMHHQIPSVLQHLECEFDNLKNEHKELEKVVLPPAEQKASFQRKHNLKIREVKQGIKKLEKLMHAISTFLSAFQVILDQIPDADGVILVLGGSLIRPQHVYELTFSRSGIACRSEYGLNRDRVAEILSKKAIRALISTGAGGATYAGPMKLFLLVKAPVTFNLPMHFLPKRDFTYSKKVTILLCFQYIIHYFFLFF
ncbi:hypothetical protein QJS04_geneDACA017522 [Acorus gramineus]|uniref:Uncharacterized protein n=1 Tax=Acorus gramineus TaxID=55184 RepID=A0AAV9BQR3_ACOGR|nr:hypothetical protein QJS04_geneDACA014399 [Acorus gramineus]KAK1278348.1 hypothetical protein QJS04_geneDACA017522 [Acorus gramineus]